MKVLGCLAAAFIAATAIAGGQAAANTCRADPLICPTTMPVDGFCQCVAHGTTLNGTVAPSVTPAGVPYGHYNATAGGCGADPDDPGCRVTPTQPVDIVNQPPGTPIFQAPPGPPPLTPPPTMAPPG
jgi:hypothetical protein